MNLVIVGAGMVGATLVENFIKEGHNVSVIDCNVSAVEKIINKYDVLGFVGSGIERDVLIQAGTETADCFIACTSRDELNVVCCVLAKKLGAKSIVARIRNPEYFKEMEALTEELGIDMILNPEYRTAIEISRMLKFPSAKSVESFSSGKTIMVEFDVPTGNPMIDRTVVHITKDCQNKVLFGMIERDGKTYVPKGDFIIKANDKIFIIGTEVGITSFCKKLKIFKPSAKSVFVIGGGNVCYYLASKLCESNVNVKIVEKDAERCTELANDLKGVSVLHGDGTDQEMLNEESLQRSDACVTLTGNDEENVVVSLYARQKKLDKVITKVTRPSMYELAKTLDLDGIVFPKSVIVNDIVRFVRSRQVAFGSKINKYYRLSNNVEALEFTLTENFEGKNVPIKNLKIKRGVIIGAIVRDGEFVLPTGDTQLVINDNVLIVTTIPGITDISEILH